ncbi:hypothetical protein [Aequorivita vladivostokensis]|jgi:hypothetical protein|uniref:Lipoprotein n=1 Tax=Aequorivita vladivostokensis TaxID=171194 RepID=A0ABR5DGU0_9FLAO|nr:hypothetical protein [Aequorivita vladivostokensis]KJJ37984.1 hypothetical protein MB09_11795 [Aequorivita vladivostokensis]HAV54556.1 hypothetical protein [Aequorivita sp.]|tara:strand:+ start:305 stop:871 length:567 start_codon:yes stop_codon:yes gene_type:complete
MKKTLLIIGIVSLAFVQCGKDSDPFLIKNGSVGNLNKEIKMKQIDSIFAEDSIVKINSSPNALETQGEVEIYEKGGKQLLLLSPNDENDPNSTITNIQVFDSRYKTEKGLTTASTFKDVKANYTIDNIETTINAVVVFLKDSDVYLTIDKKSLPEELRYNMDIKVEASQIPDEAPIKYFMIGWDAPSE